MVERAPGTETLSYARADLPPGEAISNERRVEAIISIVAALWIFFPLLGGLAAIVCGWKAFSWPSGVASRRRDDWSEHGNPPPAVRHDDRHGNVGLT